MRLARDSRVVLVRFSLFLFSAVLSLFAAEAIARVVAPRAISYPWMDSLDGITVPLANVHGRHFVPGTYDTSFSFNAQRFRGTQILSPEPDPTTTRIAVLGSSFTFGSGANDDETYPFQLQRILQRTAEQQGSYSALEVINAGIPGSVVAEEALWYDEWLKRFHPHLVILNVACVVDFPTEVFATDQQGKLTLRMKEARHPPGNGSIRRFLRGFPGYIVLSQHSELFNLLALKAGQAIRRKPNSAGQEFDARSSSARVEELKRTLAMEVAEGAWLNEDVRKSGARLAIVALPCHENLDSSSAPGAEEIRREYAELVDRFHEMAAKENIPFLDLAPILRSIGAVSSTRLFYDGRLETHPTPAGYRAIADGVAQFLIENGLVPVRIGPS